MGMCSYNDISIFGSMVSMSSGILARSALYA